MYGIFTYIYHEFMVNVGRYTIHGSYGLRMGLRPSISGIWILRDGDFVKILAACENKT